jgi:hypothetical protein
MLILTACGSKGQKQNATKKNDTLDTKEKAFSSKNTADTTFSIITEINDLYKPWETEDLKLDSAGLSQPPKPSYRQLTGNSMPFTIKIPENWHIKNKPPAGDGYTFSVGNGKADARVYFEATNDKPGGLKPPECNHRTPFQFRRQKGIKCQKGKTLYYFLSQNQQRLVFYVKADSSWQSRHADQLDRIARSLAFDDAQKLSSAL